MPIEFPHRGTSPFAHVGGEEREGLPARRPRASAWTPGSPRSAPRTACISATTGTMAASWSSVAWRTRSGPSATISSSSSVTSVAISTITSCSGVEARHLEIHPHEHAPESRSDRAVAVRGGDGAAPRAGTPRVRLASLPAWSRSRWWHSHLRRTDPRGTPTTATPAATSSPTSASSSHRGGGRASVRLRHRRCRSPRATRASCCRAAAWRSTTASPASTRRGSSTRATAASCASCSSTPIPRRPSSCSRGTGSPSSSSSASRTSEFVGTDVLAASARGDGGFGSTGVST